MAGGLFELPQEIQLEGVDPRPVLHAHQLARLVVLERRLLGSIIVDGAHQVQGGVGIVRHVAVRVRPGDKVPVAVVGVEGAVAQGVDLLRPSYS